MREIEVTQVAIDEVRPAAYNPRQISDEAFEGLVVSIRDFGIVRPLVVNTKTGNLVGGHQTLRAARRLGYKTVPVVYVEMEELKEKVLNVTLNNPHISGHYTDGVQDLISEINAAFGDDYVSSIRLEDLVVDTEWFDKQKEKDQQLAAGIAAYVEDEDGFRLKIDGVKPRDKDEVLAKVNAALEGTGYVAKAY